MAEDQVREKGRFIRIACGVFLILTIYVLGIGPVKKLELAGYIPSKVVEVVYQPLRVVNGTPLESALIWYLQLWFPPAYVGDSPHARF